MTDVVRVNDTVNLRVVQAPEGYVTAKVIAVNDQDDVDLEYYNPHRVVVENAVRADGLPAEDGEFYKVF